jgi:hypothetical protein
MANKIKSIDQLRVDVFQAIKRAFLRRGVLPVAKEQKAGGTKTKQKNSASSSGASPVSEEKMNAEAPAQATQEHSPAREAEKAAEEGPEQLIELTERTQDVLYEATTVFPFTLFPDTMTLDREKLTIAERYFWRVAKITSVPISEILSCQANVGPFFGSIHLVFSFFADNQRTIRFLWRHDAIHLQRMLHGYIIAHKREINTTNVSTEELKIMLEELGQGASE